MTTKRQYNYAIGDRVAERPKIHGVFAVSADARERVKRYRDQRYGTVVGFTTKKNSRGNQMKFLLVQWDNLKSPTEHARMRICPASEVTRLTREAIVPGE